MAQKEKSPGQEKIVDYRHEGTKRKNIPPAGLAAQGKVAEKPALQYAYNPHLPPALRIYPTGGADAYPPLLEEARQRPLTAGEVALLADALRKQEPWLEWTGKREKKTFEVDPVALHIHERVSTQAILKIAKRQDVQRSLFADPELEYREAVRFYQHDVDWTNRMILGDSLVVMSSLAHREDLAGKVQMIYIDPPYGIKFASNFQPQIGKRDVKDKPEDLTREPEMIKAYRDTWTLGIHSYLAYLRDRLVLARELLTDNGSIFVQIGDENLHLIRCLLDEVFERENAVAVIPFRKKTMPFGTKYIEQMADFIVWYAKHKSAPDGSQFAKYHRLSATQNIEGEFHHCWYQLPDLTRHRMTPDQVGNHTLLPFGAKIFRLKSLEPSGRMESGMFTYSFDGREYPPPKNGYATDPRGIDRLRDANRLQPEGNRLTYILYPDESPASALTAPWTDTVGADNKVYAVQTNTEVVKRCMLMTTDPGDLVLDPTCGSGTTAYVAEQWGRRWITIDTSRVALAIARQRLMTAKYEYYRLQDESRGVAGGFRCKTVPHITLKSIAQNAALDPIFAKHAPILAERLEALNATLSEVDADIRSKLAYKLTLKERQEGRSAVTDADRRRWLLPKDRWEEWQVPFDADPDWPQPLQEALLAYRAAWRAKMDEVNDCIAASAEQEVLVDQPEVERNVVRVSGPFTVEAVQPPEEHLDVENSPIAEPEGEMDTFGGDGQGGGEPANVEAYLEKMIRLLRMDGVRFPNNRQMRFARLEPLTGGILHAEGEWSPGDGEPRRVAVSIGPQYGPITAKQVEDSLWAASRRGYDDLVFAGFTFDAAAQAAIQDDPNPHVRAHLAHIRPDVNMGDLLKDTPSSQLFTVFGLPRTRVEQNGEGQWVAVMEGVDVYNPVDNTLTSTGADKVAAWFLDGDYDGRTFCITQAFFPDRSAWEKLARALKGVVDEAAFEAFNGTVSLPFPAGKHRKAAIKVIDPRGNEVMRVHRLGEGMTYER